MLSNWRHNQLRNWDANSSEPSATWTSQEMRARSTTRVYSVIGGDTLKFFRYLRWKDILNKNTDAHNRYVNRNGIAYSVELVDAADGRRIMLLDTFSMDSTTPDKRPSIQSWYPMVSKVEHIVPTSQKSVEAFVRVNTWTSGQNPGPYVRHDGLGVHKSSWFVPKGRPYNESVFANSDPSSRMTCFDAVTVSASPRAIAIQHALNARGNSSEHRNAESVDEIKIVDNAGKVYWMDTLAKSAKVSLAEPGQYVVIASSKGKAVCAQQIYVP